MAASQCFHEGTDVLMLTTNLIRKDFHSTVLYETGIALGAFSCFVTLDLARDLTNDVVNLVSFVKTLLSLFKISFLCSCRLSWATFVTS